MAPSRYLVSDTAGIQAGFLTILSRLVNCEEYQSFVPFVDHLAQLLEEHAQLGAPFCLALGVNQTRMAGGLTHERSSASSTWISGFCQALGLDALKQPVPVVLAEFVVELALGWLHISQ